MSRTSIIILRQAGSFLNLSASDNKQILTYTELLYQGNQLISHLGLKY
jgi:hypothetical protein